MTRLARRLIPLVLAIAAFAALVLPTSAISAPIDDKKAQAAELQAQINASNQQLSTLNEQINDAQIKLDAANQTIADADAAVTAAKAKTSELRSIVARRAASIYVRSGSEGGVSDLDAASARELTQRQKYTSVAEQRDKHAVYQLKQAQEELAVRKADAETAHAAATAQRSSLDDKRADLAAGQAKQQAVLNGVNGEIADLVRQAQAAAAADAAAKAAAAARVVSSTSSTGGDGGGSTNYGAPPPSPSARVGAVMAYAWAQLGKPYCYAGAGPGCFDCSGLTMMAWAQAGLSLPHGSYAQLAMFPRVSMSQLQVGDLVYWDSHVGIYVGSNSVLHAPRSGTNVQVTQIWSGVIGANRPG
ncbi:MAG: NlpC/P60 family protein [Acidimicrobiia bacterium]